MAVINLVQAGTLSFAGATSSTDVTITSVDTSKSFVVGFATCGTSQQDYIQTHLVNRILDNTTVRFQRSTVGGEAALCGWQVAEFTSGVSVEHGTTSQSATTSQVTIASVNTSQTFILIANTAGRGSNRAWAQFTPYPLLTSSTSFSVRIQAAQASTSFLLTYQVVDFTGCTVQRGVTRLNTGTNEAIVAITSVDTSSTWVIQDSWSSSTVAGDYEQRLGGVLLTNGSTLRIYKATTNTSMEFGWQVVEFTDGTTTQGASFATTGFFGGSTGVTTIPINVVDTSRSIISFGAMRYGIGKLNSGSTNPAGRSMCIGFFLSSTSFRTIRIDSSGASECDINWSVIQFNTAAAAGAAVADQSFVFAGW